jgi:nitrogenase molybdenum-cofactor synthesis protein NifE
MKTGQTVSEILSEGQDALQSQIAETRNLIYSSPATLAYNSPGAEGYGVKRAGLSIPGSVMLIVSPGCCGRNTSELSDRPEYRQRFFYLTMDETDLITGRHLTKIPEAVEEMIAFLPQKPSVIMICITCVDALLGTDMDRVCRKAEAAAGVPVRPCYMYALTREGRKPPMVHVRQSLYDLLEKRQRRVHNANILGFFNGVDRDSELYKLLNSVGVSQIQTLKDCETAEDFYAMAEANFNLVLYSEALPAAEDLYKRLNIPFIQMNQLYQTDKIAAQYEALGRALGVNFDFEGDQKQAEAAFSHLKDIASGWQFAVGEVADANPFELALALLREGLQVKTIYGTVVSEYWPWLTKIAALAPEVRIMDNTAPEMMAYCPDASVPTVAIGADAVYYYRNIPRTAKVAWRNPRQPFGFEGVKKCVQAIEKAIVSVDSKEGKGEEDEGI